MTTQVRLELSRSRVALLLFILAACREAETPAVTTASPPTPTAASSAPALPSVSGPKLPLVDEGPTDPSFAAYRRQLLDIVQRHDAAALIAAVDPKIRTSFGDGGGIEDLRRQWKLDAPDSPLWRELEQILTLGGTFRGEGAERSFWAPWVYSAWPESHDAFTSLAVIGDGISLHETPDRSAPVIARLSYDIVTPSSDARDDGWREIKIADGRSGWIESKSLRSPIEYRAGFQQRDGVWRMTALVAGD